jgi:hypothetical protein
VSDKIKSCQSAKVHEALSRWSRADRDCLRKAFSHVKIKQTGKWTVKLTFDPDLEPFVRALAAEAGISVSQLFAVIQWDVLNGMKKDASERGVPLEKVVGEFVRGARVRALRKQMRIVRGTGGDA